MSNQNNFNGFSLGIPKTDISSVLSLRHKVYCEELGYEPTNDEKQEQDEFDERAIHILVSKEELPVATMRVVPATLQSPVLPLSLREPLSSFKINFPSVEISRLCVLSNYRGEAIIPALLYLAATEIGHTLRTNICYAVMEPRLRRHLRRAGFDFERVSDFFDFRGKRALYVLDSRTQRYIESINNLQLQIRKVLNYDSTRLN